MQTFLIKAPLQGKALQKILTFWHTTVIYIRYYIWDITYDILYDKYHLGMTWLIATSASKINGARKVTLMNWTVLIWRSNLKTWAVFILQPIFIPKVSTFLPVKLFKKVMHFTANALLAQSYSESGPKVHIWIIWKWTKSARQSFADKEYYNCNDMHIICCICRHLHDHFSLPDKLFTSA